MIEETIKNYDSYTSGMKKSSADKLFWMSKIDEIDEKIKIDGADCILHPKLLEEI